MSDTVDPEVVQPNATPNVPAGSDDGSANWEARFKGLQSSVQGTLRQLGWSNLREVPPAKDVMAWQEAAKEVGDLRQQLTALQQAHDMAVSQLKEAQRQALRFQVLANEAPDLIGFANYIPAADTAEEISKAIADFRARLSSLTAPGQAPKTPQPPASGAPGQQAGQQIQTLINQYNEALAQGRWEEAARLSDQMFNLRQVKR